MRRLLVKMKPYKDIIENVLFLAIVFIVIFAVVRVFNLSDIQSLTARFGIYAPIAFILSKAATIVFAPLSGSPLYPVAGALFGFWKGLSILVIGDLIGGSIAFWISRTYGVKITERFVKSESSLMKKILDRLGTLKGFIFARICFIPMPEIVCYGAGLTKMSYLQFILVHAFIDIPMTALLVGAGTLFTVVLSPIVIFVMIGLGTIATLAGGAWFYRQVKI